MKCNFVSVAVEWHSENLSFTFVLDEKQGKIGLDTMSIIILKIFKIYYLEAFKYAHKCVPDSKFQRHLVYFFRSVPLMINKTHSMFHNKKHMMRVVFTEFSRCYYTNKHGYSKHRPRDCLPFSLIWIVVRTKRHLKESSDSFQ